MNRKIRFFPINEWKDRGQKIRVITILHSHIAWCRCGCKEWSIFFILFGLGFIMTTNPNKVIIEKNEEGN